MSNLQSAALSPDPNSFFLPSSPGPGPREATVRAGVGVHSAAIYCRVSSDEQAERGTSLADQASRCTDYATGQGWRVVAQFVDEGASGATLDRAALHALMAGATQRMFDRVIVTDPDRLSRDLVDGLVIERDLAATDTEVLYLVAPTMGILERQIRGVIAEEERRKIRERTTRGRRAVASAGYWPGGPPPYGFQLERQSSGRNRLAINPTEATVIVAMIDGIVDDYRSASEIAVMLDAAGVATPNAGRGAPGRGARWTGARVRSLVLDATAVAGSWPYHASGGTIDIQVPAIVTTEQLAAAQQRLRRGRTTTPRATHRSLFAKRITSPCGHPMHCFARPDRTGRAYRCSRRSYPAGLGRCDCRNVSAAHVDSVVWDMVARTISDPGRLRTLASHHGADGFGPDCSDPADHFRSLAESVRAVLDEPDSGGISRVLNMFDIRVTIDGHVTCPTCSGRGLLPDPTVRRPDGPRRQGVLCRDCRRYRYLPTITIHGHIPTPRNSNTRPGPGIPFVIRLGRTNDTNKAHPRI